MQKLNEDSIEYLAIQRLQELGYSYIHGADIAPQAHSAERDSFSDVLLMQCLQQAVKRINPHIPSSSRQEAIKDLRRIASPNLIANNETFHRMLTEGIKVDCQKKGYFANETESRGEQVMLVDFENPENNEFLAVNQFTVVQGHHNKRPDLILFINGIPLVVMEFKNATDENAHMQSAYRQLQTYKDLIPSLFTYNGLLVISDGLDAKTGSLSAGPSRFLAWKSADGKKEASHLTSQLEILIKGMLNKATLLDLIRHFTVFEKSEHTDPKTNQITIQTVKKIAAYHQYYAVNLAVQSTLRATGYKKHGDSQNSEKYQNSVSDKHANIIKEDPATYGLADVKSQPIGDRKGGVVWHTQGSGKSLSMVFFAGKIVLALDNPTILVITDRNDLDDQLFDTFAGATQLLRQPPKQVASREDLKVQLKVGSGGVLFSTIQKFQPEEGNVYETLSERENIVVIADEAHRTQYGFYAKDIDVKDSFGAVIGKKTVYGFAKYMRDALPNATYLGFTGTPIESTDTNTPAVFGNYIDVYDIRQAVDDGATVKIYYESRLAKIALSDDGRKMVSKFDTDLREDELTDAQKAKTKWTQLEALVGSRERIKQVASDIISHFTQRTEVAEGKGMIVAMSRRIAAELYEEIIKIKPEWHSSDLDKGTIKVVMTSASSDGPLIAKHHTTKEQRRQLADRMKNPNDPLQLVIVRDMWLTGFDAPSMHTLYIDKPMKGHTLMQAIARVNRVYKDKTGGLVVDYLGIASDLKKALSFYSDAGGKGQPAETQEDAVAIMVEKLEVVSQMLFGFDYEPYFAADTSTKLSMILAAEDFILGLDNGRKRFINEVTALSKAFAIAVPHEEALEVKDEISFFQAVKARLVKFENRGVGRTDEELETSVRQVIDKAIVSEKVIDVFDAAGIKKPDISILSEEFLMELKGMQHRNLALEVLKKLLNDEIKARAAINLVQSKTLMEMLEISIKRYHSKAIDSVEIFEELIEVSKVMKIMDSEAAALGLTDYEYAFYCAVADNDSAKELMEKDKLRELAVTIAERVKENTTIDWTIKENVRAGLRRAVKRTLRKYGYPPDMQKLATETVIKQAEQIANQIAQE